MVKVEIISKESIKPSSPTPQHLKIFKLSLLDQLIPAPYAPIVLFYPNIHSTGTVQEKLVLLKKSLSQTLTRFYPLAGLIRDDLSINCNDQGAYFAVAEVNTHLSEFLGSPDIQLIHNKFLPCEPPSFNESSSSKKGRVTNIQVNVFECGGFAISLCVSHKILDGAALNTFLKSWAANANANANAVGEIIFPDFMASSSLFPTDELWLRDSAMVMWGSLFKKGKCVTRRLVFDASAIATLKAEANSSNIVRQHQPTRVEVVSAFIWKCGMAAAAAAAASEKKKKRPSILTHVVNLRKRTVPTLSDFSLGNIIWIASAKCKEKYDDHQLGFEGLVDKVRKGISRINGDFVKKIRGDKGCKVMSKCLKEIGKFGCKEGGVDYYGFTSWCKLGFYEADFGWGKPVWVSSVGLNGAGVFMNLVILMDTKCGQGIEAWVTLDEQEMNILEHDLDLLALASLDPSPMPN